MYYYPKPAEHNMQAIAAWKLKFLLQLLKMLINLGFVFISLQGESPTCARIFYKKAVL